MIKEHDWADDHEFNVWRCAMGIKQVKQINAAWEAYQAGKRAASAPVQDDEPVACQIRLATNYERDTWHQAPAELFERYSKDFQWQVRKLYTRPQSDELQQENERLRSEHADLLALQDELLAVADCHPENSPYPAAVAARDIRKAAEEILAAIDQSDPQLQYTVHDALDKLRAALKK